MSPARLDPDALARLETERDFLLSSLDDLDAELAAGDIDQLDHAELHDDYTRRTAEVLRAIDDQREAFAAAPGRMTRPQRLLTIIGVVALAAIAGVLLARSVGFRTPGDEITGGIRQSTPGLLNEADTLTREGRWQEAFDIYDEVLDIQPSNVEALTYSGWIAFTQLGEPQLGVERITDAAVADPTYPDALVFSALSARRLERWQDAVDAIEAFDALEGTPSEMGALIEAGSLRGDIVAGLMREQFEATGEIDLAVLPFGLDEAAAAAAELDAQEQFIPALAGFDAVLAEDPDNRVALIGMGRRLATTSEQTAERGLELLDRAVTNDPEDYEAIAWRGFSRAVNGDSDGAKADLAVLDGLELPEPIADVAEAIRAGLS